MRKLILFTLVAIASRAGAQTVCGTILASPRFEAYLEAMAPLDVNGERIERVAPLLNDTYGVLVSSYLGPARAVTWLRPPEFEAVCTRGAKQFQVALGCEVRGWAKTRDQHVRAVVDTLSQLGIDALSETRVRDLVLATAKRADVEDVLALATFFFQAKASLLQVFVFDLYNEPSRSLSFGPREMALAREALQYAHLRPNDRVLQLGVESPSVLTALKVYLGRVHFHGVTAEAPTNAARSWAAGREVTLGRGGLDDVANLLGGGPFRMILGLDGFGANDSRTGAEQVAALKGLLVPHGAVVLLYDHAGAPSFGVEDARTAGFQILSWARERDVPADVAEVVYGPSRPTSAGRLRAYVLRLGDEDADQRPAVVEEVRR